MASKISLLHVTANSSLLEHECAAQEFIAAANAVFFKAQGLATLAPLYETVFGLLEEFLNDWHLLNLNSVEWPCKAEVPWEHAISTIEQIKLMHFEKMVIELELTAPIVVPTTVMNSGPTPVSTTSSSALSLTQESPRRLVPCNKGKSKAKTTEDDDDKEEATQKFRKELEDFVVPTTFDNKLLVSLLPPPLEYYEGNIGLPRGAKILGGRKDDITLVSPATRALVLEKNSTHVKLVQAAKAFFKWQGKLSQFFVLEEYKGKEKAKALLGDSEQAELVDSDSDKEKKEDRVHVIKKIKHEHVEEPTGTRKRKEIIELDKEVEIVAPKTPVAGPLHQTSKPIVLVSSMPKPILKPIIALASSVAGPSTAPIVPSSVLKPAAATALSKPMPVKSARREQGANHQPGDRSSSNPRNYTSEKFSDEDGQGDDDNGNNSNVAMDIDSAKHPEET
ncbi:hypothetical protein C0995_013532 [Termitomyces sp. Mi166|nr:hypothetical protein C0995_013532 [Termitomyces sp. Mi166\